MYRILIFLLVASLVACETINDNNNSVLIKFYGDALEDIGYSVAETDGAYIISGQLTSLTRTNTNYIDFGRSIKKMGVIKSDLNGNRIWKSSFGARQAAVGLKVLVLDDGTIISTGYVIDTVTLKKDLYVVKLDSQGSSITEKIFESSGNQSGNDIIQTDEGFMIVGTTDAASLISSEATGNPAGKNDILLFRINANLDKIGETVQRGYPGNDEGVAIKKDINGGYIVIGNTDNNESQSTPSVNIFIIRINNDASVKESEIIGGADNEYASDIEVLNTGYLVAGTIGTEGSVQQGCLWKVPADINSEPVENRLEIEYDGVRLTSFSVKALSRYKTNSFVLAGHEGTGSLARMLFFISDDDGNIDNDKVRIFGGTGSQIAYDVISDAEGNIISVGKNSFENNSMITFLKFKF